MRLVVRAKGGESALDVRKRKRLLDGAAVTADEAAIHQTRRVHSLRPWNEVFRVELWVPRNRLWHKRGAVLGLLPGGTSR